MTNVVVFDREDFRHSDGELPHGCSEVWALAMFRGRKVHFWGMRWEGYKSLCGVTVPFFIFNGQNTLFGGGTYPKCKRCMERLRRLSSTRSSWHSKGGERG